MTTHRIRAGWPEGGPPGAAEAAPPIATDRDSLAGVEEDGARSHGRAAGLARPRSEREVALTLRECDRAGRPVLAQGARSSLTAGATPRDDVVLALEGLDRILEVTRDAAGEGRARVEPGVRLRALNEALAPRGLWFPPVPTYDLCCTGGAVATNAAGAATFKYGAVRPWVRALRVVLASGQVLAVRRGETCFSPSGELALETADRGTVLVPLPRYRTPPLKKVACGYHVRDGLDLVDLFVGAEGTLGVVTEVELALAPLPGSVVAGLATFPDEARALAFAAAVRAASEETARAADPAGVDVRAIEWVDADSLALVRERGKAEPGIELPPPGGCFVLWEQELAGTIGDDDAAAALGAGLGAGSEATPAARPLAALGRLLAAHGAGEDVRVALPHDEKGRRLLGRIREVVPETVNELVAERKRTDPGVRKVAGDMVVPADRLPETIGHYRRAFAARGLRSAIWGHVSDGNVHPNVLARSEAEARAGEEALLELGDVVRSLGGAPLSEHGVGKSPTKQELLRRFLGDEALHDMARLKRALDPRGVLAPGNIFPRALLEEVE